MKEYNYDSNQTKLVQGRQSSLFNKKYVYGLVNNNNELLLDIKYTAIYPLSDNKTRRYSLKKETGIMDENFNILINFEGKWISEEDELGQRRFATNKGHIGIFDKNFNIKCSPIKSSLWIGPLEEGNTRRVILQKTPSFGSFAAAGLINLASVGLASRIARASSDGKSVDIQKKYNKKDKDESDILFNRYHSLEVGEYYDQFVYDMMLLILKDSANFPVYGVIDNNNTFIIEPKYHYISPVLEDNTRECKLSKKSYIFDILANTMTYKGK